MVQIVRTGVYERWVRKLKDRHAVARISVAIRKISLGNLGDVKPVGGGVSEEYLDSEEMIAEYLAVAFEEGDSELIRVALNDVARARGMTDLQKQTGLSRSALYKALGEGGNPTLDTLLAILKALGVKMSVVG